MLCLPLPLLPNVVSLCRRLYSYVRLLTCFDVHRRLIAYFFSFSDFFFFLVLDIGRTVMSSLPVGVQFAVGWLQVACVRTAGFAVVPLSEIAPASQ